VLDRVPRQQLVASHVYADSVLLDSACVRPRELTTSPLTLLEPGDADLAVHPIPWWGRAIKRTIDVTGALIGLIVLAIPLLIVALLVRRDSSGPAFFVQERMGLDGRIFKMVKFRTMAVDNDISEHQNYVRSFIQGSAERQNGNVYKMSNDPRVTRFGRHLRHLSIDELPQLWNVLKGDMSLVGPRPCLPYEADLFDSSSWQRLRAKPGISGLWQVSGRCELTHAEAIELDVRYWREWSLALELKILLLTPIAIIRGTGAA
jgi:lipopolysaccharide/colanic/teichoic acid biosynthesis glycosyltransferase